MKSRGGPGFRWSDYSERVRRAQHQAAGEQREAAEQDRDGGEAGERQLARLGRCGLLALGLGLLGGQRAAAGLVGASPPPPLPLPPAGAFSSSAGRTPPSPQMSDGVTWPPPVVGVVPVGVGVQTGVAVGVGVPYCEIAALLPFWPWIARPAPAVLNTRPATSIPRMARRDFMDWFLREGSAARRRTRCLISSSSRSVA